MDGHSEPTFAIELELDCSPESAWKRLWDLDRHEQAIPATRIQRNGQLSLGSRFTALTGPRWVAFADPMVVRAWDAPRAAVIEKTGQRLRGVIRVTICPTASGSRLTWHQSVSIGTDTHRKEKSSFSRLLAYSFLPVIRAAYARSIRRILA